MTEFIKITVTHASSSGAGNKVIKLDEPTTFYLNTSHIFNIKNNETEIATLCCNKVHVYVVDEESAKAVREWLNRKALIS